MSEKFKRHDKATMNYQRKILALFGLLLPILAPSIGFLAYNENGSEFWYSISATFYASSNILMIGILAIFAFFLWSYKGYDIGDEFTCKFSACMAAGILIFPCKCKAAGENVGIFNLPADISHIIHCIIAGLLFASFAYMIGYRFTKHSEKITRSKYRRNIAYQLCCILILIGMLSQIITSFLNMPYMTIFNETVMLWAFSFAWYVKADGIKKLND